MTVRLAKIVDPEFTQAYRRLLDVPMPMKTAFDLKKIAVRVGEEQRQYEEMRKDLLQTFGDKEKDGTLITDERGMVKMTGDNARNFQVKHQELLEVDVDVGSVSITELGDLTITPVDLMTLESVIQE